MEVACPACFARFHLAAALTDAAARRALAQALRCTKAPAHLVLAYLDCFRAAKRSLSWRRAEKLLAELADAMEAGSVRRKWRDWQVADTQWIDALTIVVGRRDTGALQTPLRDHAYLWEVVSGLAGRTEAAEERRTEEERRSRAHTDNGEAQVVFDISLDGIRHQARGAAMDLDVMEERAREAARHGYQGPWDDPSVRAFLELAQ